MSKSSHKKFEKGNWVFVPVTKRSKKELDLYLSKEQDRTLFKLCKGRVMEIQEFDPSGMTVEIKPLSNKYVWVPVKWVTPLEPEEVERVRYENQKLAESNRQMKSLDKKRDELMKDVFKKKEVLREVNKTSKAPEKKKLAVPPPFKAGDTLPFYFDQLDDDWFDD